jgi:transcription elongation factor GreA
VDYKSKGTVLTRQGYDEVQKELDEILKVRRPAVVNRIREATALGDLSENFDYHDAKREQGMLEARIIQLKGILECCTVIDSDAADGCIGFGSRVKMRDVEEGFEDEYVIVGPPEADPSAGKISYESAVGAALLDHKVGDIVAVTTPAGTFEYEVLSVE